MPEFTRPRTVAAGDLLAAFPALRKEANLALAGVEGTRIDPPMLIEGVDEVAYTVDPDSPYVHLSVWSARHRAHTMHGFGFDHATPLDIVEIS